METPMIFETHAHYDDEAFAQDRENLLASMQKHGIGHIVNACASVESLKDTEELMEKYPFVYGAFGFHPADAENMNLVKDFMKRGKYGGIIHCFSYGKEIAGEYLDMRLNLGIGGVVTFKNAKKLKEVVAYAPLEQLVLETDSPYLSPEPYRGKRNSSLNLAYVAEAIAQIKEKEYALRFKGKTAERKEYTGRILAVGISYNSKTKEHECKIEQL